MNLDEAFFLDKSENTPIKLEFQGGVQPDYAAQWAQYYRSQVQ